MSTANRAQGIELMSKKLTHQPTPVITSIVGTNRHYYSDIRNLKQIRLQLFHFL